MSNSQSYIAVDLDDVLFDFIGEFFHWHNRVYGTALVPDDMVFGKLWQAWEGTREQAVERVERFFQELDMLQVPPVDGSVEVVRQLAESHSLSIVSARDPNTQEDTDQWIAEYFSDSFEKVILGIGNPMAQGRVLSKPEVCLELGAKFLIDDQLVHAIDAAEAGIGVLLFGDRPWNRTTELPANVRRVTDWYSVRDTLRDNPWTGQSPA